MFCKNCGTKIPDDSAFCSNCGEPVGIPVQNGEERKNSFIDPAFQVSSEKERNLKDDQAPGSNGVEVSGQSNVPPDDAAETAPQDTAPINETADAAHAALVNENVNTPPTPEARSVPTSPDPAKKGKTGLILGIAGGAIVLILIVAGILTFVATRNHNVEPFAPSDDYTYQEQTTPEEVVPEEQVNTVGSAFNNISCTGIAAMQGDTIYYMMVDTDSGNDKIMSMAADGGSEQELYSFADDIYFMNVLGDCLYFNGDVYDDSDNLVSSNIYCYHLDNGALETIYPSSSFIYNLYVIDDKMYFSVENNDSATCDVYSANIDGSNPTFILNTDHYGNGFIIDNGFIYYANGATINRCYMDGQYATLIYTSSGTISNFCLENNRLYVGEYTSEGYPAITSMSNEGADPTTIYQAAAENWIDYINIDNGIIYFVDSTYSDDSSAVTATSLCSIDINGGNQKTLATATSNIYGPVICDQWLFYYDVDKGETVKIRK